MQAIGGTRPLPRTRRARDAALYALAVATALVVAVGAGLDVSRGGSQKALLLPIAAVGAVALSAAPSARPLTSAPEVARIVAAACMLFVLERLLTNLRQVRLLLAACFGAALVPLAFAAYQAATSRGAFLSAGYSRVRGT